jgi:hypothetical protein
MGTTIGPDDILELINVVSLTEAGAENPVLSGLIFGVVVTLLRLSKVSRRRLFCGYG